MLLIEKEFLSFGHQFALRIGISQKDSHNEDQRSPIFLQWLDCIHQLLHQFPEAFEFNMDYLLNLAFHYNSCLYGTFMYNSECERAEKKAKIKTASIWTDMIKHQNRYLNSKYEPVEIIIPNSSPFKMRFWEEFFFRFNTSVERNCLSGNAFYCTGLNSAGSVKNSGIIGYSSNSNIAADFDYVKKEALDAHNFEDDKSSEKEQNVNFDNKNNNDNNRNENNL